PAARWPMGFVAARAARRNARDRREPAEPAHGRRDHVVRGGVRARRGRGIRRRVAGRVARHDRDLRDLVLGDAVRRAELRGRPLRPRAPHDSPVRQLLHPLRAGGGRRAVARRRAARGAFQRHGRGRPHRRRVPRDRARDPRRLRGHARCRRRVQCARPAAACDRAHLREAVRRLHPARVAAVADGRAARDLLVERRGARAVRRDRGRLAAAHVRRGPAAKDGLNEKCPKKVSEKGVRHHFSGKRCQTPFFGREVSGNLVAKKAKKVSDTHFRQKRCLTPAPPGRLRGLRLQSDAMDTERTAGPNFIRQIVAADVAAGKNGGRVQTRFPPEPNGYLHIGHAKAICIDFGIAEEFGGTCYLRFDDTNPGKEDVEYVEAIKRDVRWLGFDWGDRLTHASDYFPQLYEFALQLIRAGKAYGDHLSAEEIRAYRGTLTEPGRNSPYRDRSVEENLELFERMRRGEFDEGECVLRAKIDMASPNMNLRDPTLYRIRKIPHQRTGTEWCIYPLYDFAHTLSDALEGTTHSLCSLEFEDHRPLYEWFLDNLPVP